jgi:hypothetical protein
MYQFFLLALGAGFVMTSHVHNKFSNKTYCEKRIHIFGDDENDTIFSGVYPLLSRVGKKSPLLVSHWTNIKKRCIKYSKILCVNIIGPVKNFDDEYARLTFTLFS